MAKVGKKVNANELADAIMAELNDYKEYVSGEAMRKAMKKTAEDAAEILQADAPVRTGEYKDTFQIKEETNKVILYSEGMGWKTHLLEKGHALRGGGRTIAGKPHWSIAEASLPDTFEKHFKEAIK